MKHRDMEEGVSILIPTFNEAENIQQLIGRIKSTFEKAKEHYEIILIDDYSTDKTVSIARELMATHPLKVYFKEGQKGKAFSILEGARHAIYSVVAHIDGDLQYPPEEMVPMLQEIRHGADVVIANRRHSQQGIARTLTSRLFNVFFCHFLHQLPYDVQSGLKLFRKEIIERVQLSPTPWTFDLEFLCQARDSGYHLVSHDITFAKRLNGKSKISVIGASYEIGRAALKLWFRQRKLIPFSQEMQKKKGIGFHYKGTEYISHTQLQEGETALQSFTRGQVQGGMLILMVLAISAISNWHLTLILLLGIITGIYLWDLLFHLLVINKSLEKTGITRISQDMVSSIKDTDLPLYTILCPLYKEWEVVRQFVKAIGHLAYPAKKIQVLLLLEESDTETRKEISRFTLPTNFQVIVVPNSLPRTKPKACNYGLRYATGEYTVIYDAEDIPEPTQLKKAVIAFKQVSQDTACLQAKLNYFNPHQNILTKLFTAEYSLWFDVVLPGLQAMSAPIPLGGTSNHFHTEVLRQLNGWDAFNVTEDCDLGIRLFKYGYKTKIFNSTTLEEANSHLGNWINQRSRWIKGYIQTYFVHMRSPRIFIKQTGWIDFMIFQLVVGGKIFTILVNPLMWIITFIYFLKRFSPLGLFIESLFPPIIFYFGVFSCIVGNFLYLYTYMIGSMKRKHYSLVKYTYLVPIYWLLMSLAGWKAMVDLVYRPHYWAKTKHGFMLQDELNAKEMSMNHFSSYAHSI